MQYISADHIAAVGGGGAFEPQRTNNFTIRFAPPARVGGARAVDVFALSLSQIPFPSMSTTPLEVHFGNEVRKVTGKWTFSNETLQVKDYVDAETSRIVSAWVNLVYDPESGRIGYAHEYKVNGEMLFFGPDGNKRRAWRLVGMWPTSVKYGEGNMGASNHNQIEIIFAVDKMFYLGSVA
jgi:hypothetical protein